MSIETVFVQRHEVGGGPLTFAVKDCIDIAGQSTRQGSAIFADAAPAPTDARVVANLLASGDWRLIGKLGMHELAFGVTGINPWEGTPVNPLWPDRIVGGSSSGSAAAVAAGMVDMALGTDTGGSVRLPAACCGVIGFKPGYGVLSREGVHPVQSSLDSVGLLTRGMDVMIRAMKALAPPAAVEDGNGRLLRLAVSGVEPDVQAAFEAALDAIGSPIADGVIQSFDAAFDASLIIMGAENWAALGAHADHPGMGEDVRARLKAGARHGGDAVAAANAVRAQLIDEIDDLLRGVDSIVLPTLPCVPPTLDRAADARALVPLTRLVRPFNLSGHPAITLPIRTAERLPAGLQLVGRRGGDAALLSLAARVARRLGLEEKQA